MAKILIVNDRSPLLASLINLGDRALTSGLFLLLSEIRDSEVISGGWKNFPYINRRRFPKQATADEVAQIYQRWADRILSILPQKARQQEKWYRQLEKSLLLNNPFFRAADRKIKLKMTRGVFETISPYLFRDFFGYRQVCRIKQADIVVSNTAGMIAEHLQHYLPMIMFECYLAKRMGKTVTAVNQTVDVRTRLNTELVASVYNTLDLHITRDRMSTDVLMSIGVAKEKIISSCDSAFVADYTCSDNIGAIMAKENISRGDVGIILRGDRPVDCDSWTAIIRFIRKALNKQVVLLYSCKSHDEHVYKKLQSLCGVQTTSTYYNYPTLTQIISNLDMLVTDRYHACIFGISAGTPVVPVNPHSIKVAGLFSYFDYPVSVLPPLEPSTIDWYKQNIGTVYEQRQALRTEIKAIRKKMVDKVQKDYKVIEDLIPREAMAYE